MPRKSLVALALPAAFALAACGGPDSASAHGNVDLQRDLKLAATSTMQMPAPAVDPANFNDLETRPPSAPRPATHLVKAPGPRAIASRTPELKAAAIPEVAATTDAPQVQTVAQAPTPEPTLDPVARMPRRGAGPVEHAPARTGASGDADRGQGAWGIIGPVIGVVIRGGDVDGDNCEPHGARGRRPGIYVQPAGGIGTATRFPTFPRPGTGGIIHR